MSYGDTKFLETEEFGVDINFEGGNDKNFPIGLLYVDFLQDNNVFAGFGEFTPTKELGTQRDIASHLDIKIYYEETIEGDDELVLTDLIVQECDES